jgi:hypothetical protein
MGGSQADAEFFWKNYGHLVKKMRIMVGTVEGGPYTTLSPDVELGSTPHALWSRFAGALQFPYIDSHSNLFANPETMISLHNEFGGTILNLSVGVETDEPTLRVAGQTLFDDSVFGFYAGELQVNSLDEFAAVVGISKGFPILGELITDNGLNSAAVLGEVNSFSDPFSIAVWALNHASGNEAALGTGSYSGDFSRDVIIRRDLRVRGEPTRDYASNSPSPIGPLAYGSVASSGNLNSGTANISSSWDAINSWYLISVTGKSLAWQTHTISVSVVDFIEPRLATFSSTGGDILVKIWDINSGNIAVQDNFSIVIYDSNPTVLNRIAAPNGMDEDKYTEKTGVQLIQTQPCNEPVEPFENYGSGVTGE